MILLTVLPVIYDCLCVVQVNQLALSPPPVSSTPPRLQLTPTLSAAVGTVIQIFRPAPVDRDVSTSQPNWSPTLTLMYVRTSVFWLIFLLLQTFD